jgi:DNA-binding NarL/FixJ family response regulator
MSDKLSNTITILIADDEPMARAGIRAVLEQADDFEIIGEAQDGFEVQELIPNLRPKIALLDYRMPGPRAFILEEWIRENHPKTTALVLTAHDRDGYLSKAVDSGMAGFLLKNENAEQLILAVRRAASGTAYFSEEQIERAQEWKTTVEEKWNNVSARKREILKRLATGEDNKTISASLTISIKTVEFHVSKILEKLGMKSRNEAIVWMLKHQPDDPWLAKD